MYTLQDQIASLSIKENLAAVKMVTANLKAMRDQLMNLEYEDLTDTDSDEIDEDVKAAEELLKENPSEENETTENTAADEKQSTQSVDEKTEL